MPEHAFGYDDRIIDEHADREHEAHHRQHVQTEVGKVQCAQGYQQRKRHGGCHNQSGRYLAQKQVKNDESQQSADCTGIKQVAERVAYAVTLVVEVEDIDALHLRQLTDFCHFCHYTIGNIDHVRASRLADSYTDCIGTIKMTAVFPVRTA